MPQLTSAELDQLLANLPGLADMPESTSNMTYLQMFGSLGRDQLNRLITEKTCAPGDVLFWENDPGDAMYIIRSGLIAAIKGGLETPTLLGYRGPGEVLGEMALVESQPRSASGIVVKESRLMIISRADFQQMMRQYPELGLDIMKIMSSRLRASDEARLNTSLDARELVSHVSTLQTEKQQLLELQRLREETSDLIVHDLRSPLNVIMGTLQLLPVVLPEDVWQANRELIEIAQSSCERLRLLTNTMLDVARMENGDVRLELAFTNISDLASAVVRRMAVFARDDIRLEMRCPAALPGVMADQSMLDRVLTNLVDNALKHTPPGGQVTVTAEKIEDRLLVSINDTGAGIPPEERERIFERFAQTAGEKRQRRGFGLGLAFCRLAVKAHGGRIWVEPGEAGRGSRFVFSLPLSLVPAESN